jgi:hypothetical protein
MVRTLTWSWMLTFAVGCGEHGDTISSSTYEVASPSDAACPTDTGTGYPRPFFECHTDEGCLPHYSPLSPVGKLHYICFDGQCYSADYCVRTNAGAPDFCTCTLEGLCPYPQVCVEVDDTVMCDSRCSY